MRSFLSVWDAPGSGAQALGLLRSAFVDEQAADRIREIATGLMLPNVARALGLDATVPEVAAALASLIGMISVRRLLRIEPLASLDGQEIVRLWGPVLQHLIDVGRERNATVAS